MADQIQCINGFSNYAGIVEKIFPERHIRQHQWRDEWNEGYFFANYPDISDYECIFNDPVRVEDIEEEMWLNLQAAKQEGLNLLINNLAHFPTNEDAVEIIDLMGFLGEMKKINEDEDGNDVSAKFSWWSPKFEINDRDLVRNTLRDAIQPFLGPDDNLEVLMSQFATSDAFILPARPYSNVYFQFGINELCQCYENYIGDGELQYKILGTFSYMQEVIHAVLVCSQANAAGQFAAYPPVPEEDINNEAVVTRDANGNWIWKPQSTGTRIRRLQANEWQEHPYFRRGEQVAFAFHISDELGNQINVPDLHEHLHLIQPHYF